MCSGNLKKKIISVRVSCGIKAFLLQRFVPCCTKSRPLHFHALNANNILSSNEMKIILIVKCFEQLKPEQRFASVSSLTGVSLTLQTKIAMRKNGPHDISLCYMV